MSLDQLLMVLGLAMIGVGGVLHYAALPYRRELPAAGTAGGAWSPARFAPRGRRIVEAARAMQAAGVAVLLLSLFL